MKAIIENIAAIGVWIIFMLFAGVMESDLSFKETIIWIVALFAALFVCIAVLGGFKEDSRTNVPLEANKAKYGNE